MIINPKRILWPTDFSPLSLKAGNYALALTQHFSSQLHIVHVIVPPLSPDVSIMLPAEAPVAFSDDGLLAATQEALKRLVDQHLGGDKSFKTSVFFGNPWMGVCDYAKNNALDLIVVGTHGRTGLSHVLIGSTAERIVQHAPCPVLTIKEKGRDFVSG